MSQVINTNVLSMNAQRNLSSSQGELQVALERLSSGLRINSAKDDAAGLAISERFSTQIRGMNQAIRNSNDGVSLAQTAEGAMAEVANNLQRIRELAVQARNATNSDSDREALDAEVQQRIAEIQRVATQTEFNGLALLDGSFNEQVFQVGANFGQTISVEAIAASTSEALGLNGGELSTFEMVGTAPTAAVADGDLTINDVNIGAVDRDASDLAAAINASGAGVTAEAQATTVTGAAIDDTDTADLAEGDIVINGVDIGAVADGGDGATHAGNIAAAINDSNVAGVTAEAVGDTVELTATDGRNIEIAFDGAGAADTAGTGFTEATTYSTVTLSSLESFTVAGDDPTLAGFTAADATENSEQYAAINVLEAGEADNALRVIDDALTLVNGSRADLGAVQNRFESVVANLGATVENLSASRSRILDTDFAAETAALTRAQVLQQAGVSMLAQANAAPQNVLALLG